MPVTSFDDYLGSLGPLTTPTDPTLSTPAADRIRESVAELEALPSVDEASLVDWVQRNPAQAYVLGLTVGIGQEKLKNQVNHWFGTGSWAKAAREHGPELIRHLDDDYGLLRLITVQRGRRYSFADVLIARAGTRVTATSAGRSGRRVEDELEKIAQNLRLPYEMRGRFEGRNGRTAPADLAVPATGRDCVIAVAAKGFDSTGSKLSDAVREIEEMADARTGRQVVLAVVDGIGWKGRQADLKRIWTLWSTGEIDGLYTLSSLDAFRRDLDDFASGRRVQRLAS